MFAARRVSPPRDLFRATETRLGTTSTASDESFAVRVPWSEFCGHSSALKVLGAGFCEQSSVIRILRSEFCAQSSAVSVLRSTFCVQSSALRICGRLLDFSINSLHGSLSTFRLIAVC